MKVVLSPGSVLSLSDSELGPNHTEPCGPRRRDFRFPQAGAWGLGVKLRHYLESRWQGPFDSAQDRPPGWTLGRLPESECQSGAICAFLKQCPAQRPFRVNPSGRSLEQKPRAEAFRTSPSLPTLPTAGRRRQAAGGRPCAKAVSNTLLAHHISNEGSVLISHRAPRPLPGGSENPCGGGRRARCDLGRVPNRSN